MVEYNKSIMTFWEVKYVAARLHHNVPNLDGYDAEQVKKTSGKQKLKDLGLDDEEIQALMGV